MLRAAQPLAAETDVRPNEPPAMLMSAADLAREFRVSVKTITRMDQSGKLPRSIKVGAGRAKRWNRDTIVAWVAAGAPCRRDWERVSR